MSFSVLAGFKGSVSFSEEEKRVHLQSIHSLTAAAEICLKEDLKTHTDFYKKYGISAFYGQNSAFSKMSQNEKRDFLIKRKLDPKLLEIIKPTSCVGLSLKCLERGFSTTGQTAVYKQLLAFTVLNGVDGTALQHGLRALGWKTLYWNPDTSKNKSWDRLEKIADRFNKKHFRGFHEDNFIAVKNKATYYFNEIDISDLLLNFSDTEPNYLKGIPFFIGTAHMGYHVFPGYYGVVVEAHSTRAITDEQTIESAPFNPLSDDGAPSGRYRSGLISIPPSF
jgi:hypothetical protein